MCLLQLHYSPGVSSTSTANYNYSNQEQQYLGKMSVKGVVCNCIPDPLVRHADIMSKAEFQADMNEMKSKWNRSRICHNNNNNNNNNNSNSAGGGGPQNKRRPWKGEERSVRGRKKSGNERQRVTNGTNSAKSTPNGKNSMGAEAEVDVVDSSCLERIPQLPSESSSPSSPLKSKRVHFDEENLVEVTEFPDDEESAEMRKCYWEIFARDRGRFKDRISQAEDDLKMIFMSEHRQRIYNQRFLPLIET